MKNADEKQQNGNFSVFDNFAVKIKGEKDLKVAILVEATS